MLPIASESSMEGQRPSHHLSTSLTLLHELQVAAGRASSFGTTTPHVMAQVGAPNTTSEAPDPQKQRGEDPSAAYASPSLSPPSQDLPATGFQSILHPYPVPTRADHLTRSADDGDDRGARDRSQAPRVGSGSASRGEPPADLLNKTQGAFIPKLYAMCSSDWLDEMIAWTDGGATFTVFCPSEFSRTVLPQFFKHSNYNSLCVLVLGWRCRNWLTRSLPLRQRATGESRVAKPRPARAS